MNQKLRVEERQKIQRSNEPQVMNRKKQIMQWPNKPQATSRRKTENAMAK